MSDRTYSLSYSFRWLFRVSLKWCVALRCCADSLRCMCVRETVVCLSASVRITNFFCCLKSVCKQTQNGQVSKRILKIQKFILIENTQRGNGRAHLFCYLKENNNKQAHFVIASQKVKKLCVVISEGIHSNRGVRPLC